MASHTALQESGDLGFVYVATEEVALWQWCFQITQSDVGPMLAAFGACISDLRSVLNYLARGAYISGGGNPSKGDDVYFPTASVGQTWEHIKKVRRASPAFLEIARRAQEEPQDGFLWLINKLDNSSKHRFLGAMAVSESLETQFRASAITEGYNFGVHVPQTLKPNESNDDTDLFEVVSYYLIDENSSLGARR